jgi:endonuclease/exonuclease/phosphatase family metal-dependent hydrolase
VIARTGIARWAVLAFAVLLAGCAASPAPGPLAVMTYNIHHGEGTDGRFDLERLADVIIESGADLVALQEVDRATRRASGVDQAATLGRLTGMHAVYGPAMDYDGGAYGVAVLSRHPVHEVVNEALPYTPGHEPRTALAVRVDAPDCAFHFIATHLQHDVEVDRIAQARAIVALAGRLPPPVVVAGDLNAELDDPPMAAFAHGWRAAAGPDATSPLTWPSEIPTVRIDYVLLGPGTADWRIDGVEVIPEPIASDHRPVVARLRLTSPPDEWKD